MAVVSLDGFNSRPCVRGDEAQTRNSFVTLLFQFTPLREGRLVRLCAVAFIMVFQFTPLREGRPVQIAVVVAVPSFNSRPCVRGDATL